MASGKKGKKTKGKTLNLHDFLEQSGATLPSQPIRQTNISWADEVDDDVVDPKTVQMVLPTAPKASRGYDDSKVPTEPPFMAYLSNLPYDVDEDEIADFFSNMKIINMNIPKADRDGEAKLKGFGYVEFEDRESLMKALIIPDAVLKNRRIRIEVSVNTDNDKRRGRMGDRMGGSDTGGDWRSTNRPDPVDDRRGGGGYSRNGGSGFSREGSGAAFTREGMREGGRDRDYGGFSRDREGGFNRDRDFGRDRDSGFRDRNRDQDERPGAWRDGERDRGFSRPSFRDSDRNRDDRDDRDRRGGNRDDRDDRDRRGGGFRRYDDKEERNGGITRSSNRGDKDDRDSETTTSEPRQRPKLQLAPRTKPIEPSVVKTEPAVPSASIFGSAKPVDTTERERQVEEKLLKQQEERLGDSAKDRKEKEDGGDKKNYERGRPYTRRDDTNRDSHKSEEISDRDRGPPSKDRRNVSREDNRKFGRNDHRSPDKKKYEKQDRPKHEERRGKSEVEMPKFQEPEPPNFQGSNKFALLHDNSD